MITYDTPDCLVVLISTIGFVSKGSVKWRTGSAKE